jgi:hypothetical protein
MQPTINFTWPSDRLMEIPRFLWLGATTLTIGILLMLIALQPPPERRDTTRPRFDERGAADLARTWKTVKTGVTR